MPTLPAAEQSDLRQLIAHRESVQASDPLEVVHQRFASHEYDFMLVLEGARFVGLCERQNVGMILGARFGFAMHSRQPVKNAMVPEPTIIRVNQPLAEVLRVTCSRPSATLYQDVVLMGEADEVLGIIYSQTLVRLQNQLLQEKIEELNAKNSQMEGDLQLAREIQLAMLPTQFPAITAGAGGAKFGVQFGHRFESAGVVSGDFFHVLRLSEATVGIFICDVMGHGVRSAFVTAVLRALVEEMRMQGNDPAGLLARLNAELITILKPMESPLYATAFYLVADAAGGTIRFAKAGHPAPMRWRRTDGAVERLQCAAGKGGPALGLLNQAQYANCDQSFAPGDMVLFFTDGIYEIFDAKGDEFGPERMMAFLASHRHQPVEILLDGLLNGARSFAADGKFEDDVCLILMEALEESRP